MDRTKEEQIQDILNDEVDIEGVEEADEIEGGSTSDTFNVCSGNALDSNQIYGITAKEKTKMVVLAGLAGSGKTTIETSIYQMFQRYTMAGLFFAGSNTIQGYEQRAYYTRTRSRGLVPMTQRTSLEMGQSFLHLRLWKKETDDYTNLLFADLSGEAFESHIGCVNDVKKDYSFMDRADYFVGVLDGELLNDKRERNNTISGMIELVRTFCDAEVIGKECVLQIIFSKCDVFGPEIEPILEKAKQRISKKFHDKFCDISFFKVAAMPEDTEVLSFGYGLEELLRSWLEKKRKVKSEETPIKNSNFTEFDKLSYKLFRRTNG